MSLNSNPVLKIMAISIGFFCLESPGYGHDAKAVLPEHREQAILEQLAYAVGPNTPDYDREYALRILYECNALGLCVRADRDSASLMQKIQAGLMQLLSNSPDVAVRMEAAQAVYYMEIDDPELLRFLRRCQAPIEGTGAV